MNERFIKKVDRVKSVDEALSLQNLGAEVLCVSLNKDKRFSDDRYIQVDEAAAIRRTLTKSELVVEVATEQDLALVQNIGFDYIQIPEGTSFQSETIAKLLAQEVKVIYSGIEASYEDDPSWIVSTIMSSSKVQTPSYLQVSLFADVEKSWNFLKNETPKYPEEFQVGDVEEIAKEFPLLIMLDFSPDNVLEIVSQIPSAKGICMTLAESSINNATHFLNYESVIAVLSSLAL